MKFYYSKEGALKYMTGDTSDISQKLVSDSLFANMLIEFDPLTKKPIRARSTNINGFTNTNSIFYDKSGKPSMIMTGEQGPKNLHFKDLRNNLEVFITRKEHSSVDNTPFEKYIMNVLTKDSEGRVSFARPDEGINISLTKKKKDSKKTDRYALSLESLKSETADYSINRKKVAKYNVKTGDIEMLPDCGVSSDTVKAQLDELGNQYRMIKKYYRNAYKYKNKQADLSKAIEKSLEDYGDKDFYMACNAGIVEH